MREPGRVANGLSTITARLTAANDGYIASITGGMGTIDKNTGELRSTYDVLKDLSEAWGDLTSVERQELAEKVAGKTQRSLFTALMTNYKTAIDATSDALNSEGSAEKENEKRKESLQGKVQQLQSAWQSLSRDTINSEFVKSILDAGVALLKFADSDIGRTIITLTALIASVKLLTSGLNFAKTAILTNGQALFQYALILQGVPAAQAAASASSLGLAGSLKILTTALVTNPIFLAIAAFSALAIAISTVSQKAEEAREASKNLAETKQKEAEEAQGLLDTYEKLSKETDRSTEDNENLSKTIQELSEKYGISEDALKSEGEERDKAIKKIQSEIAERKKAAALASEAGIDWKKTNITGSKTEKEVVTSRDSVSIQDKLSKKYDLTADSVANLQKKLQGYITTLQNKNDKTKEEEKELNSLLGMYDKVSDSVNTYKEGYAQALQNYKDGIPITTEQANALYQLGEITDDEAIKIQAYNDYISQHTDLTEEQIEKLQEVTFETKSSSDALAEYTEQIDAADKAAQQYQSALDGNIESMINYGSNMDLLSTAQTELSNTGYITAETFKSLSDNNLLQYLDDVNGKLQVNTQAFVNSTDAIKENALANLQATTYEQIRSVVLEDLQQKEKDAGTEADNASSKLKNAGDSAVEMGKNMIAAAGNVATLNTQLAAIAGQEGYTASDDATKKIQNILESAKKTQSFIESWKPSSSKAATKSTKSKKSSSTSSKDTYKATIDNLYNYKNALENSKESVDKLKDAIKDTQNFNEQERSIRKVIDALNDEINKTNELKNAQTNQITDYINQLRQQGFEIDYNASNNELYVNNMQHLADFSGDTAKNLEKLIKKIQDLNDDNRDLDGTIRDLRSDVKDYYEQLEDFPEEKLKKFNELMKEFQQGRLDQIQNQIDDIQHEMENDPRIKQLEAQIDALENQNDELDKQKELEEKILAVEEAKEKLANQKKQRNIQLYTEESGWTWVADIDAIKDAQDDLKDAQDDLNDKIKQDQIDQLNAEKDALEKSYQDRIDALQNFLDEQNYQIDKANREGIQSFQDLQNELAKFGLDSEEYLGKASDWLNNYNKSLADLNNTVNNVLSSSTAATDGMIYSSAVQDRITQALSGLLPNTTSTGLSLNSVNYDKIGENKDNQSIYINNIELPNVKDVDDFVAALKELPRMASTQSTMRT